MRQGSFFSFFFQPSCRGFKLPRLLPVFRLLAMRAQTATSAGSSSSSSSSRASSPSAPAGSMAASPPAFSAGVMSVRPQKNRKSFNPSPQPLQVLHEDYSKLRVHWSCVNGLGILAHPKGSICGHHLASMDKEMVYVTKQMR